MLSTERLTGRLLDGLPASRHANGARRVRLHGPADTRAAGIALRAGCFCKRGCSEQAFHFHERPVVACLEAAGEGFTIPDFATCLGGGEVGAIRLEPIFTTRRDSGGTGLGLAICVAIAQGSGGVLQFASRLGEGTRVRLSLPLLAAPTDA